MVSTATNSTKSATQPRDVGASQPAFARELVYGFVLRLVAFTIPLLIMADLSRALGKQFRLSTLAFAVGMPIVGLVADAIRLRNARAAVHAHERKPLRFGLRSLLIVLTLASLYCAIRFSGAVEQRGTLTTLRAQGVPVTYDDARSSWLRYVFGEKSFGTVRRLALKNDEQVKLLRDLPDVQEIYLWSSGITDASIEDLSRLKQLRRIELGSVSLGTAISPAAVARLKQSLPDCEITE